MEGPWRFPLAHQLPVLLVDLCVDILNRSSLDNGTLLANATSPMIEFWEYVIVFPLFRLLSHPKAAAVGLSGWKAVHLSRTKQGATCQTQMRGTQCTELPRSLAQNPGARGLDTAQRLLILCLPKDDRVHTCTGMFSFWH